MMVWAKEELELETKQPSIELIKLRKRWNSDRVKTYLLLDTSDSITGLDQIAEKRRSSQHQSKRAATVFIAKENIPSRVTQLHLFVVNKLELSLP